MFGLILQVVAIAALVGLGLKFLFDYQRNTLEITWVEYFLGLLLISFVLVPFVAWAGWSIAKSSNLSFNEYRNGWELQAVATPIQCTRDGPCWYEYDCDPYIIMVSYSCNCDSKGNCSTCWRPETRYHDCPYVTVETSYSIHTTLGNYPIAEHRFPENPQSNRWRSRHSIPQYTIDRAGVGSPQFWKDVDARVRAGRPGPVTKRATYNNYILASDSTIITQYSGAVEKLLAKKMLPQLSRDVYQFYLANKVYRVGSTLRIDAKVWNEKVTYLNAAFGQELQGDLHLVLVHDADLQKAGSTPDEYILALKAYWQNPKYFGKDAFSKNAILVIVGTNDNRTVSWGRAVTGMPLGNERMAVEVRNSLSSFPFTPETVVGNIRGYFEIYGQKVRSSQETAGQLSSIIWGRRLKETRFRRISMTANDEDDVGGGFMYLANEIKLTKSQRGVILFTALFGCGIVWLVAATNGIRNRNQQGSLDLNQIREWWKTQWQEVLRWVPAQTGRLADKIGRRRAR